MRRSIPLACTIAAIAFPAAAAKLVALQHGRLRTERATLARCVADTRDRVVQ